MVDTQFEDLKLEVIHVKKDNLKLKQENDSLKIKVRRLEDSITQKHRLIDNLVDPQKTCTFRKDISEHGASMIIVLREENEKLRDNLKQSEQTIKRLQKDIDSSKAYLSTHRSWTSIKTIGGSKADMAGHRSHSKHGHITQNYSRQQSHIPKYTRRAISAERSSIPNKNMLNIYRSKSAKATLKKTTYAIDYQNYSNASGVSVNHRSVSDQITTNKITDVDTDCSEFDSELFEQTKPPTTMEHEVFGKDNPESLKEKIKNCSAKLRILEKKENRAVTETQPQNRPVKTDQPLIETGSKNFHSNADKTSNIDWNDKGNKNIILQKQYDHSNEVVSDTTKQLTEKSPRHSVKNAKFVNDQSNEPSEIEQHINRKLKHDENRNDELIDLAYKYCNNLQTFAPNSYNSQRSTNRVIMNHAQTMTTLAKSDVSHPEINELQSYFKSIISEVKTLKESISSIKKEQEKTTSVLKEKETNLERLTGEVKTLAMSQQLKNHVPQVPNPSNAEIYRIIQMDTSRNQIISKQHSKHETVVKKRNPRHQYKVISLPNNSDLTVNILTKNGRTKCTEKEMEQQLNTLVEGFSS